MKEYNYLILGAGPSGLAFSHTLLEHGETSFLVLEKESQAGGLCRSIMVDGSPLDIGGGHFLDPKISRVKDFLFRFQPECEWNLFHRKSSIDFGDYSIDYPIEANLWQMPVDKQVDFICSQALSGENLGMPRPDIFEDWIFWRLGRKIAEEYMLPYNRKIWSIPLNLLGTYWMEKLPVVSFREVIGSCLQKKPLGSVPAHKVFYYPKQTGYGEVWDRMGKALKSKLLLNTNVEEIDVLKRTVNNEFHADFIINTLPWNSIKVEGIPSEVNLCINNLMQSGIRIDYFSEFHGSDDHWIYYPNEQLPFHRMLNRAKFLPGSKGYWTETNLKRIKEDNHRVYDNAYAYPLNTIQKPEEIKMVLNYTAALGVHGLGRWGTWEHINSDVAVIKAMELADILINERKSR